MYPTASRRRGQHSRIRLQDYLRGTKAQDGDLQLLGWAMNLAIGMAVLSEMTGDDNERFSLGLPEKGTFLRGGLK